MFSSMHSITTRSTQICCLLLCLLVLGSGCAQRPNDGSYPWESHRLYGG